MATTIYDVAKAAGVSPATVSRVFNRRPNVSSAVRETVLHAAQDLGYLPQQSATRDCYAIVMEQDLNPGLTGYQELLLRALNRQAYSRGHRIELVPLADMPTLNSRSYHGVIGTIYQPDHVRQFVETAKTISAPAVLINSRATGVSSICTDEHEGMKTALEALTDRGHRSILHIGHHSSAWCAANRIEALDRLAPERDVRLVHVDVGHENLLERVTDALDPANTALLVTGEGLGHRVLHYLRKLRLEPGREVAIVAHEMPGVSEFCAPPLTTIEQDFAGLTESAMELLGGTRTESRLIGYRFHDRESIPLSG